MRKLLLLILGTAMFFSVSAQEESEPQEEDAEQVEAAPTDEEDEAEEPIVDDEFYQDIEDEDFRPSEDIPADQSIPFPTDI